MNSSPGDKPAVGPMGALTVAIDSTGTGRWSGSLPVQVRDVQKLVLAGSGVSGHSISLPPGRYLVTAMLPDGRLATAEEIVELGPGDARKVDLALPSFELPRSLINTVTLGDRFKELARPVTDLFASTTASLVTGNWLLKYGTGAGPVVEREPTSRSSLEVTKAWSWIELERESECTYLAVPVEEGRSTVVQWSVDSDGGVADLKFDFGDGQLNSFFDFVLNDQSQGARAIGRSVIDRSDEYLDQKRRSPLLAVLGAYVLLRANMIEDMDVRTDNLMRWFPWLPDALAIRIEYLARQSQHGLASSLMLEAPARGIPWFRSGVGYLESRARMYASVAARNRESLALKEGQVSQLADVSRTFGELAAALDMSQSTTVLRGMPRVG